jgi:enhancing lycopene biosynthesis protein 2
MARKVVVVLSGCGVFDGSEIHEAVITLLTLSREGAEVQCAAPDVTFDEVDHLAGQPTGATRSALVEAARIARGEIVPLSEIQPADHDALFFPGGFGAAKNLSSFAVDGPGCTVEPEVLRVIRGFHAAGKPIGAVCIAPALLAAALGQHGAKLTIGDDPGTAAALEAMGAEHHARPVTDCLVDPANKLVTAPAYMLEAPLRDVAKGISAAVRATLALTR